MQNHCLPEQFFSKLDSLYETCYRLNPDPTQAFLDRMALLEIKAKELAHELENIRLDSYRHMEPDSLTEEERLALEENKRQNLIISSFMPLITGAYFMTSPAFWENFDS
jgi:hypothetical protein